MQRHGETKEAPVGFAIFDHGKPHIDVKSTACSRPVVHGQGSAEQQQSRTHVRAGHPLSPPPQLDPRSARVPARQRPAKSSNR